MRTCSILLAGALLLPALVQAQTIRGTVVEVGTGVRVAGATIDLLRPDSTLVASATSDSTGYFQVHPQRAGRVLLRPSRPSYSAVRIDTLTVRSREVVTVYVQMGRAAIPMEPLVVTARSRTPLDGFYDRQRRNALGQFLSAQQIRDRHALRPTDLLLGMARVQVVPVMARGGFSTNYVMMRGTTGHCVATVYLDGMPLRQYDGSGVDDIVPLDILEGVEIYSSATTTPGELTTAGSSCGVVAFWTQPGKGGRPFTWRRVGLAALVGAGLLLFVR